MARQVFYCLSQHVKISKPELTEIRLFRMEKNNIAKKGVPKTVFSSIGNLNAIILFCPAALLQKNAVQGNSDMNVIYPSNCPMLTYNS